MKGWIIAGIVVVVLVGMAVGGYNSLVSRNETVNGKWAQVESQLQRRSDLVPNLVATVQGLAAQERAVIQSVTDARAKLAGAQGPAAKAEANDQLSGSLSRLLVVVENYPTLKSDKNFLALQDELAGTENRLASARNDYNDAVQLFNAKIQSFPSVLYAKMFAFSPKEYFRAAEGAKQVPQVKF